MGSPEKIINSIGYDIMSKASDYNREWKYKKYHTDPEHRKKILDRSRIQHREYYKNNPEKFKEKYMKQRESEEYKAKRKAYQRNHRQILKQKVIAYYSKGKNECSCCGENHREFLQIDHVNGGGEVHRREIKRSAGQAFYTWLIRNNFPEGYRVLCSNCNQSYGMYGYCPHQNTTSIKVAL